MPKGGTPPNNDTQQLGNGVVVKGGKSNASLGTQGLVLPQPRVVVGGKGLVERVVGWGFAMVEAIAVRAILGFLRRTVVKVRSVDVMNNRRVLFIFYFFGRG